MSIYEMENEKCGRCSDLHLYAPCARKGCGEKASKVRYVSGNVKATCDKHTPCCKGRKRLRFPARLPISKT